jgi:hypothetical protein
MRYFVLTISLCLSLFPPTTMPFAHPGESASLQVSVFNDAGISPSVVTSAESQASRVFQEAGISIHWLNCSQKSAVSAELARCAEANFPCHLHLHLIKASRGLNPATLGVSFLSANGAGCCADLFDASVKALALSSGIPLPVVLGHAMAHELGHVLLGTNSHSVNGLMRSHWDWENLQSAQRGELLFLRPEAAQIRNRFRNAPAMQACVIDPREPAAVESPR